MDPLEALASQQSEQQARRAGEPGAGGEPAPA
jgi:hypothetical protein